MGFWVLGALVTEHPAHFCGPLQNLSGSSECQAWFPLVFVSRSLVLSSFKTPEVELWALGDVQVIFIVKRQLRAVVWYQCRKPRFSGFVLNALRQLNPPCAQNVVG